VKRVILVLTVAAMMAAMTLGVAGSAMAQQEGGPSADDIMRDMGFYQDPNTPGCWVGPGSMRVCVPVGPQ
jgi:hypothetical protein